MFRPRKKDVEQLQQRDFLGKAKVNPYGECCVMGLCKMVGLLQYPSFSLDWTHSHSHVPFCQPSAIAWSKSPKVLKGSRVDWLYVISLIASLFRIFLTKVESANPNSF